MPENEGPSYRLIAGLVAGAVGFVAAMATLIDLGGRWGVWTSFWQYWLLAWSTLVFLMVLTYGLMTTSAWWKPSRDCAVRRRHRVHAGLTVCFAVIDAVALPLLWACGLVSCVVTMVAFLYWSSGWLLHRRLELLEDRPSCVQNGLRDWGRRWIDVFDAGLGWIGLGPRGGAALDARSAATSDRSALFTGLAVVLVGWFAVLAVVVGATYGTAAVVVDAADGSGPTAPTSTSTTSSSVPSSTTTTTLAARSMPSASGAGGATSGGAAVAEGGGTLRCTGEVGAGEQLSPPAADALDSVLVALDMKFHLCAMGPMVASAEPQMFEQPLFTNDGEGAVLVVWRDLEVWRAALVSSDDARSYRHVSPTLDWSVIGRPMPFMACDGLWVQIFVGAGDEVVGVGVRDRDDVEGEADQPLYVWGSTLEALLDLTGGAVLNPRGYPDRDARGPVQNFEGDIAVHGAQGTAARLTAPDMQTVCER